MLVSRGEAAVASLLADESYDFVPLGIEDDDRHTESEVLEVLAHAKEVIRHVVIEKEILHLFLRRCGSLVRVIHKATAIAHLRIEDLASGKRFIGLYQIQDFVGHLVVCPPPRHITQPFINDDRVDVTLFLEHAAAIDRKHSTRLSVGQQFDTVEIKKLHNLAFFSKIME